MNCQVAFQMFQTSSMGVQEVQLGSKFMSVEEIIMGRSHNDIKPRRNVYEATSKLSSTTLVRDVSSLCCFRDFP